MNEGSRESVKGRHRHSNGYVSNHEMLQVTPLYAMDKGKSERSFHLILVKQTRSVACTYKLPARSDHMIEGSDL